MRAVVCSPKRSFHLALCMVKVLLATAISPPFSAAYSRAGIQTSRRYVACDSSVMMWFTERHYQYIA